MGMLKSLLDSYEKDVKGWVNSEVNEEISVPVQIPEEFRKPCLSVKKPIHDVQEGFVFEVGTENLPVLLVVVEKQRKVVKVALMCDQWELATERDVLVDFSHPIRNMWIVETDIVYTLPLSVLKNFSFSGRLNEGDLRIVKMAVNEEEIPLYKRGRGYNDPIHRRFKEIEMERMTAIFETLMRKKEKTESVIIEFSPEFKEMLVFEKEDLMVASSQQENFETESFQGLFIADESKVVILPKEDLYGKRGRIKIKLRQFPVEIYRGILKDIEIRNCDRELFEVIRNVEVEIDNLFASNQDSSQERL
jgi:hypothetical protein